MKYGTTAAAHDWQSEVRVLARARRCQSGERTELEWLCKGLKKFEAKMTMVGEDDDLAKDARVLN